MAASISTDSPADSQASDLESTFERILVPIDFSAGSRRALAAAMVMQRRIGSEVHLFHLATPGENDAFLAGIGGDALRPADLVADAEARLRRFVENLFPGRSADVQVHARGGIDVVNGIRKAAESVGATMVLLGGRSKQSLFRTQIEKIVRDLDGAVMLLRVPDEEPTS